MSEGIGVRLVALATLALLSAGAHAQEVPLKCEPRASGEQLTQRPSPYDSASVRVGNMEAKICYSRPIARDRVIFGGLVPYDMLWRTGANAEPVNDNGTLYGIN